VNLSNRDKCNNYTFNINFTHFVPAWPFHISRNENFIKETLNYFHCISFLIKIDVILKLVFVQISVINFKQVKTFFYKMLVGNFQSIIS